MVSAENWICDGYSLECRYLGAGVTEPKSPFAPLWDALIHLSPLPANEDLAFALRSESFVAGQFVRNRMPKGALLDTLRRALDGNIELPQFKLSLKSSAPTYQSNLNHGDQWYSDLNIRLNSNSAPNLSVVSLAALDSELRKSTPPFDGLNDISSWLNLQSPGKGNLCGMKLIVSPPADLDLEHCFLRNGRLNLTIQGHELANELDIGLAVRAVPDNGIRSRMQLGPSIEWKQAENGIRTGSVIVDLPQAENVIAFLTLGNTTVRRQWFVDPSRARNQRFLAVQCFDRDSAKIREALFDLTDPRKFELGVASLLFLHGFTPSLHVETNAPDLIVATPGGRFAVVECTTRIADFDAKVGKLVDRKLALQKALRASGHLGQVSAVLVCRLPRDQIAADDSKLRNLKISLVTGEGLNHWLVTARQPSDPDEVLMQAENAFLTVKPQF